MPLSTAAHPSPFDPLDRMPADEPRFVIRGSDPAGPPAITEWARNRRNIAYRLYGNTHSSEAQRLLKAELEQCREADDLALEWKERQTAGEQIEERRAQYSEVVLTEEQVLAAKLQKNRAELVRNLREAAYHACEILEHGGPSLDVMFADLHERINEMANAAEYGERKAEAA